MQVLSYQRVRDAGATRRVALRVAAASCLAALCVALSCSTGFAAPAAATPQVSATNQAEIARTRTVLAVKVADYVALARELQRTRAQISEITTRLAEQTLETSRAVAALNVRAAQVYRTGNVDVMWTLLESRSLADFVMRFHYLVLLTERDARLIDGLRLSQSQNLYLQESLRRDEAHLLSLESSADAQQKEIRDTLAQQEAAAASSQIDLAQAAASPVTASTSGLPVRGGQPTTRFDPNTLITDANYTAVGSMLVGDVQKFLSGQPGMLKSYVTRDHSGAQHTAAEIIVEAATAWGVSPKVILATLQKEQSLLSERSPSQSAYDWAMGAGKTDSKTFNEFKGFGNQIWWGAFKLHRDAGWYKPGATMKVDTSTIHATNASTYGLYQYTPHLSGNMSFWMIYWRYFGDPLK